MSKKSEAPKTEAPKTAEAPKPVNVGNRSPKKPKIVWYESRNKEPTMFNVAGIRSIRNFSNGRLEYKVPEEDVERFERNHFVSQGRIVRKAVDKE